MDFPIVTFTTDFGVHDHYVGTMKGVVLGINPAARVVDICNAVQSFDVLDGALTLWQAYHHFPPGTIHLVVVDPGVGSARRPIVASAGKHIFVAPDNGVLSLALEREENVTVRHIDAPHYYLQPVSQTFHGRDIFAPIAAWLSKGIELSKLGEPITDYVRFAMPRPKRDGDTVNGVVLKVDKFGNLVTNLTAADVPELADGSRQFTLMVGKASVKTVRAAYAEAERGEVFAILGSMGFFEVSASRAPAAQVAGVARGGAVTVHLAQ